MSENNNFILLKDNKKYILNYTDPKSVERKSIVNSLYINETHSKVIHHLFDYLHLNKKNFFTIKEFSKYEEIINIEPKKLIIIINKILNHLSPDFCSIKKSNYLLEETIILKEKRHILLSTILDKMERLFYNSFLEKKPLLMTMNKIINQFKITNAELESIVQKIDKENFFTLIEENTSENFFFVGFIVENETFFIVKKILLQTIYQYFFFIEKFLFTKDFFTDNLLLILQRELGMTSQKIRSKLKISEINIYNMLYGQEEDILIDSLFFLRFYRILKREIYLKINKDKQASEGMAILGYKISKLLYFILSTTKEGKIDNSNKNIKKEKIESLIGKYASIDAYQNNKKILMISFEEIFSIKVDDNNSDVISNFYNEKELKTMLANNDDIILLEIGNRNFFIHRFRLLYTYIYMIKKEKQYLMKKMNSERESNILNKFFFSKRKNIESFLSKNISRDFIQLYNQLKKIIYEKKNKEDLLIFVKQGLYIKKIYSQEELNYIESINKVEHINYVFDSCYNINGIYPFCQMLNIDVF